MIDARSIGPSPKRYVVTWPHGHTTLATDDVVVLVYAPGYNNLLLRPSDMTLHSLAGISEQYVHLKEYTGPEEPKDASAEELPGKEPSEDAKKFVEWFMKLLKETDAPTMQVTDASRRRWAQTYDRMIAIDKRTKEQIVAVCRWARNDPFWRQNFLSPNKLRDKKDDVMWFDMFLARVSPSGGGTMPVGPDIYTEPEGWREKAAQKWPDMEMPEKWTDLSATIRNALLQK